MELHTIWFVIVAFFWVGFFVLEGFDFGVGVLHTIIGRTETERRVALNTIGPWWDGNEVWLIVAGAGMFAAFPLLVRDDVLRPVSRVAARAARADGTRRLARVQRQTRQSALAEHVDVGNDARQPADPVADRCRPRRPARRAADQLQPRLQRQLLEPADALRAVDRAHASRPLPAARCDVPEAANDRCSCASAHAPLRGRSAGRRSCCHRLGDLDPQRRRRRRRPRTRRGARRDRGRIRGPRSRSATTTAGPSRPQRSRSPRRSARSSSTSTRTS